MNDNLATNKDQKAQNNSTDSSFLTDVNLELRTPLNTIIGYSELLQEDLQSAGMESLSTNLSRVIDSAKYLLDIINNISELSKVDAGKLELIIEDIFLEDIITEFQSLLLPRLEKAHKTLSLIYHPTVSKTILLHTDAVRLRKALLNVISHIEKFTRDEVIELVIQRSDEKINFLNFSVRCKLDKISNEQLEKFFYTFTNNAETARQYGSVGISFYLARRFAEILGGGISIETQQGEMTVFSLIFPISTSLTESATLKAKFSEVSTRNEKNVLIIDSTPHVHLELQALLSKDHFSVLHAFNCEEGIKLARLNKPGVIILDIPEILTLDLDMSLPLALDGWGALSMLKSEPNISKIPVIVMSAISEDSLGFSLGAVDYINKPVNILLLSEKIKQFTPTAATA